MNARHYGIPLIAAGLMVLPTGTGAAQPLSKDQVIALVAGNTVTWKHDDPSHPASQVLKFGTGGEVTRTLTGVRHRGYTESGRWEVNAKGQLCTSWPEEKGAKCSYVVPEGGGNYNLTGDPAKRGKTEITGISK